MKVRVLSVYGAIVLVTLLWDILAAKSGIPVVAASHEDALEAIKLLKDWSSWLAGIETGAIAAVGALIKDGRPAKHKWLLTACLTAFGLSLLAAAWLLATLPRLTLRLKAGTGTENDIIGRVMPFYLLPPYLTVPVRVGLMVVYEHVFFIVGIVLFCWLLLGWQKQASGEGGT
jgi:hypothetical protein